MQKTKSNQELVLDSPRKLRLKKKIHEQSKKIKRLQYSNRRLRKRVATLEEILNSLTEKNLITEDDSVILEKLGGKTKDLLKRMKQKKETGSVQRSYTPELKSFALTLHFYSARAYKYVRKTFDTCLPAPRTLTRWYSTIDGRPGFTSEALKAIKERVGNKKVYASLIIDEMKIMESEDYHINSGRTFGYVDFGFNVETDCEKMASEVLVFLLVALNESWKVPIAYFATTGTNAEQKSKLILIAVELVHASGVEIKTLTFDGHRSNLATAKKLGCCLDISNLKPFFKNPVNGNNIYVFLDPCHMLKNVRNAFEVYGNFEDSQGREINWKYLEELHKLQESELFHLANKLRANHIYFKTKIMKVRLASQLFSDSVADALSFCDTELRIFKFCGVEATAEFLKKINVLFDILDSRVHQYGFKRAMNLENYETAFKVLEETSQYLKTLKHNETNIMNTLRFTGFLGFCICAESAKGLFDDLIKNDNNMTYLPLHKISQDHIEIFFGNIRSHGRCNDNPTLKLFESIYKRMLVHLELMDVDSGNCVPLESITILNCSSKSPVERINMTTARRNSDIQTLHITPDDDELPHVTTLSPYGQKVVEYIAGFVVHKLLQSVKCETCTSALLPQNDTNEGSLIAHKDKGKLIYPSSDTISICQHCELELRKGVQNKRLKKVYTTDFLLPIVTEKLLQLSLYQDIHYHTFENDDVNHVEELTKAVAEKYLNIRIAYIRKQANKTNSKKHILKKLIHNRSQ